MFWVLYFALFWDILYFSEIILNYKSLKVSLIPVLNKMIGEINNTLPLKPKCYIMPRESWLVSSNVWFLILAHIGKIFDSNIIVLDSRINGVRVRMYWMGIIVETTETKIKTSYKSYFLVNYHIFFMVAPYCWDDITRITQNPNIMMQFSQSQLGMSWIVRYNRGVVEN